MNSFRSCLGEGRDAPLYHVTKHRNIEFIIDEGISPMGNSHFKKHLLRAPSSNLETVKGVSFTRDFKIAERFGIQYHTFYAIFKFDQRKLAQRYKILPIDFFSKFSTSEYKNMIQNILKINISRQKNLL